MRDKVNIHGFFTHFVPFLMLFLLSCQASAVQPSPSPDSLLPTATTGSLASSSTPTTMTNMEPTQTAWPTATQPEPATLPTGTTVPRIEPSAGQDILVNFGGVKFTVPAGIAGSVRSVFEPGTPLSMDIPYFGQYPNRLVLYLDSYVISNHFHTARIEIYPAGMLGRYNPIANEILADIKDVISTNAMDQPEMPFLPIVNAAQVFHARSETVDFENGDGYRFLTVYSQGFGPIANYDLFYAYQGLTSDGQYLVAAYLPVNAPILPVDRNSTEVPGGGIPFIDPTNTDQVGLETYLKQVAQALNALQPGDYTPNLDKLDSMMRSLRIDNINGLFPGCPALLQANTRAFVSLNPPTRNRLRAGPSTDEAVIGQLEPGSVVEISSGPVCANSLVFWNVYAPALDLSGWTAESDLTEQWLLPCPQEGACPPDWLK